MTDQNSQKKHPNLFDEFPPVSRSDWEDGITEDLEGADYREKLRWNPPGELSLLPFYVREDLKSLKHMNGEKPGEPPFTRGNSRKNRWRITEDVTATGVAESNKLSLNAIEGGANTLLVSAEADPHEGMLGGDLRGISLQSQAGMKQLLDGIDLRSTGIYFDTDVLSPLYLAMFSNELKRQGIEPDDVSAFFQYNPFTWGASRGRWSNSHQQVDELIAALARSPFRSLGADGSFYYHCGASIVQELGIALSIGSEYLAAASGQGVPVSETAASIIFKLSAGPLFFPEIAKFRAARLLWNKVVEAYDPDAAVNNKLFIHSATTPWNKSVSDAHNNMLRVTTEAMAAVIGGADSIQVSPYDSTFREPDAFSRRISRNVHHILAYESHLDKVSDPGGGSYYIEVLTDRIAKNAWNFFKFIERQGGFRKSLEGRFLQLSLEETIKSKLEAVKDNDLVFVGTNKYTNPEDKTEPSTVRTMPVHSMRHGNYEGPVSLDLKLIGKAFNKGALIGDVIGTVLHARKQLYPALQPWRAPEIFERK